MTRSVSVGAAVSRGGDVGRGLNWGAAVGGADGLKSAASGGASDLGVGASVGS